MSVQKTGMLVSRQFHRFLKKCVLIPYSAKKGPSSMREILVELSEHLHLILSSPVNILSSPL